MRLFRALAVGVVGVVGAAASVGMAVADGEGGSDPFVTRGTPHPGADQIFWVPTFAQAEVAARQTGRLVLVMGSVGDWKGY
ncbi:hypothetical protein BH23VER1_BH23VER1_00060 [soil metagenome]